MYQQKLKSIDCFFTVLSITLRHFNQQRHVTLQHICCQVTQTAANVLWRLNVNPMLTQQSNDLTLPTILLYSTRATQQVTGNLPYGPYIIINYNFLNTCIHMCVQLLLTLKEEGSSKATKSVGWLDQYYTCTNNSSYCSNGKEGITGKNILIKNLR